MTSSPRARLAALCGSVFVGALVTLQSAINGQLAHQLGTGPRAGVAAATISFGSGLALLTLGMVAFRSWRARWGHLRQSVRLGRLHRWQLLGGLAGAFLVASQGLTVSRIGVAVFVVAVVAGQTASALYVDHFGLGPAGRSALSAARITGAVITVLAVIVSTGLLGSTTANPLWWLALLPLLAGAATAVQQAINGHVAMHSNPAVATWNNFVVGWCALVVAFALSFALPGQLQVLPGQPWLYLGGVIGVVFIATASVAVRVVGVLTFGLASVCGQVVTALIVDVVTGHQPGTAMLLGAGLVVVGVAVAARGPR